jgi:hypothetical protein
MERLRNGWDAAEVIPKGSRRIRQNRINRGLGAFYPMGISHYHPESDWEKQKRINAWEKQQADRLMRTLQDFQSEYGVGRVELLDPFAIDQAVDRFGGRRSYWH